MTPIAEAIFRALAMGRSKNAALVRAGLKAEGIVVEAPPLGLSTNPEAVRKRAYRARHVPSPPSRDSVPQNVPDIERGGVGGALSLSSDLSEEKRDPERERESAQGGTVPKCPSAAVPSESATLDEKTGTRRRGTSRNVPDSVPGVLITADAPISPELAMVAERAGVTAPSAVWAKFTAFYDGKSVEMPKAWRLWCLRERVGTRTVAEAAEPEPDPSNGAPPLVLLPESECVPREKIAELLASLSTAGRGGKRLFKTSAPEEPLPEPMPGRREAAS